MLRELFYIALVVTLIGSTTGAPRPGGKIVGGFPINITQVPWQVAISDGYYQICGGSIISDRWILTAAHCLYGVDELPYIVLTGTTDKEKGDQRFTVDKYIIHENYISNTNDYDFGLLRLSEKLTFSDVARAVQMPKVDDEDIANGTPCLISGWGVTQNQSESSRYLRAVEVPKVDQDLCNKAYSGRVTPRMFCAGLYEVGGKYACQGDSGGPVVVYDSETKTPTVVGIVSWGRGCALRNYPGAYSKVLAAREWIQKHTGI